MSVPAESIDAQYVETGSTLATRAAAPAVSWTPSFAVAVDDAIDRKAEKRRFFEKVMDEGLHYGVIPGTGTKPTLLKPGAEMLLSNMGLNACFVDAEPPVVDVMGTEHGGEAYLRYRRICRIYRQLGPTEAERMIVAEAAGSCSSWETKYRYRNDQRKCPECGKPAIIKGKTEYGGGFVCFKKKDGCGAKFADNDPAIVGQAVGKVANPDVAELENTILKMADKRALVAATLIATGCSDIFTQDAEDGADPPAGDPPEYTERPVAARQSVVTPKADPKTLGHIQRGLATLNLSAAEERARYDTATNGRLGAGAVLDDLDDGEANVLLKMIAAEVKARKAAPNPDADEVATENCGLCEAKKGESHNFDGRGIPCPVDQSEAATTARAQAALLERNPELREGAPL